MTKSAFSQSAPAVETLFSTPLFALEAVEKAGDDLSSLSNGNGSHFQPHLREILSLIHAGIYTCDELGRVTFYNESAAELWQRRPEIGQDLWCGSYRIFRPDGSELPLAECPMAVALREGRPVRGAEIIIERLDGTRRHVLPFPQPIRDAAGKIVGALNVLVDITDQKSGDDAHRRLAAIVESSDDAIVSKNLDGTVTSWNRSAERLFGYTAQEMIGRSITILIPADRQNEEPEIIKRLCRGEKIDHYETVRRRKDGRLVEISLTISPIKNAAGKIVGASKIARDITERKQIEQELRETQEQLTNTNKELESRVLKRTLELQETNSQLETFVYSIAHDLRSPLRAMEACSKLLLDEYGDQLKGHGLEYAGRIKHSAEFLDKLLLDLLEFGRTARAEIELGPVSVQEAWGDAIFQCQDEIKNSKADISVVSVLPLVRGQKSLLTQILFNLLRNAIRFVPAERHPEIRLRAEDKGEVIRLWIEDNGIGIAPEHHERIFRLFERLNGSIYGGTGIGLSFVRKSVERLGGRAGVESAPGQGSRFWIEFKKATNKK